MSNMQGKVVFITGASRGIGAASAREFVKAGAKVVLAARSASEITAVANELDDAALAIPLDVSDYRAFAAAFEQTVAHFGALDVLINNAGTIEPISLMASSNPDSWGRAIDVNVKGVYNGMRAAMPIMQGNGGGSILTIGSGAAHNALEGWSHYCASKAAVFMLNQCAHKEGAGKGIRAINLSPGTVATQMQVEIKASGINPVSQMEMSDHIAPEWVARTLVWMCGAGGDDYLGQEIALRDEGIRRVVGLI
ncbi:MAG: SDR family oxidoreductase [Paracoccaceae bacterium]|nr:SDR family oxidoreductase [Paracoccaceae bacterium]